MPLFKKIPRPVGRLGLGSGIQVIASFQKKFHARLMSRLGLGSGSTYVVGRLKLGPHVVGRLGSGVWVSASFQIFALTAGERPEGNCPGRGMSRSIMSEGGECPSLD